MITLQANGSIFYGQKPGKSEWGESVCEIVGVFSGPDPHVVVQWTDGSLSVRDMDAVGEAGEPIPCKGWAVVKTLRGEVDADGRHALWPCRYITPIGLAECQDPWGNWHWMTPKSPRGGQGPDREYRFLVEGEEKERVVILEGFALTEGPDHYMDVRGCSVGTGFEWRVDLGPPEQYLPSDASESELARVLETLPERPTGKPVHDTRLLPYELAHWWVSTLAMGRTDWATFCSVRPSCIPAHPEKVYGKRWTGWGDWLGLTGRAARRAGTTSIEEDFQRLPLRDRELYLRFRNELDLCREAMMPHLEYRR